ncbi:Uncharacterised protein [uncultured archaeon]|nr:Uncharacterised protein [uncultured archaeon]
MDIDGNNLRSGISFLVNTPAKAFLDIGGHYITGLFLMQRYFPEMSKKKKAVYSYLAGLSPDLDYLMPGVPHKLVTHSSWYAAMMGLNASACNSEDFNRTRSFSNIGRSTVDQIRRIFTSRYAKVAFLGALFHLYSDSLSPFGPEAKTAYFIFASGCLYLQNRENARKKSLEDLTMPVDIDENIKL